MSGEQGNGTLNKRHSRDVERNGSVAMASIHANAPSSRATEADGQASEVGAEELARNRASLSAQLTAFRKLMLLLYGLWFLSLTAGTVTYQGEVPLKGGAASQLTFPAGRPCRVETYPYMQACLSMDLPQFHNPHLILGPSSPTGEPVRVRSKDLPLHNFDAIFRRTGHLLLFALLALRWVAVNAFPAALGNRERNPLQWPAILYATQAAVRAAIHQAHQAGMLFGPNSIWARIENTGPWAPTHPHHVMSDHILLGAAVMGGAACEAALPLLNWGCVCGVCLCVCVCVCSHGTKAVQRVCLPVHPCVVRVH
jgi:hypothetical protein